ncbi:MAG: hypothetical protein RJA81_1499 [Planctomycetota bacterium]
MEDEDLLFSNLPNCRSWICLILLQENQHQEVRQIPV